MAWVNAFFGAQNLRMAQVWPPAEGPGQHRVHFFHSPPSICEVNKMAPSAEAII